MLTYWPIGVAITVRRLSPERLISAPCPPKMPIVGKVMAAVNPALRPERMRESSGETRSAARSQLLVFGRSSGPCATGSADVLPERRLPAGATDEVRLPVTTTAGAGGGMPQVLSAS